MGSVTLSGADLGRTRAIRGPQLWMTYLRNGFPIADYLARKAEEWLLAPLALALLPLSWWLLRAGVHIWPIYSERLGHQCLEADCAIRWSRSRRNARRILLVSRRTKVANAPFFDFLPPGTGHLEGRLVYAWAVALSYFSLYRRARDFCRVPTGRQTHRSVLNNTSLVFRMENSHREHAHQLLTALVRASRLPEEHRNFNTYCVFNFRHRYRDIAGDQLQSQRYSSARPLCKALRFLLDSGIVPVLTGSPPKDESEDLPLDLYVNYADSPCKSQLNDVLLSGNAAFCLGSTSGLTLLSSVFGIPCVIHNQIPYKEFWYSPRDILIPKLIHEKSTGELLPFSKVAVEAGLRSHYIIDSEATPYRYDECSDEDILAAVIEMCQRLGLVSGGSDDLESGLHGAISRSFQRKYADYLPVSD